MSSTRAPTLSALPMATHVALARVEFAYDAQTEDEITVQEDQVVWVLEDDDPE